MHFCPVSIMCNLKPKQRTPSLKMLKSLFSFISSRHCVAANMKCFYLCYLLPQKRVSTSAEGNILCALFCTVHPPITGLLLELILPRPPRNRMMFGFPGEEAAGKWSHSV